MTPKMYRKKPVEIQAVCYDKTNGEAVTRWCGGRLRSEVKASDPLDVAEWVEIPTLEGVMVATLGDYIIRGVQGEFYPCKPDIFEQTYEIPVHVSDENLRIIASAYDDGDGGNVAIVPTDDHPWFAGMWDDQEVYLGMEHNGTLYSIVYASDGFRSVIVGRGLIENEMGVVFHEVNEAKAYVEGLTAK